MPIQEPNIDAWPIEGPVPSSRSVRLPFGARGVQLAACDVERRVGGDRPWKRFQGGFRTLMEEEDRMVINEC